MTLYNTQRQPLNTGIIKAQLKSLNKWPPPKIEDVEKALGEYYLYAMQLQRYDYLFEADYLPTAASGKNIFLPGIGSQLLSDIITILQSHLSEPATADQVIDEAIKALVVVIPGSVYIEAPAKILMRYLVAGKVLCDCPACNINA